MFTLSIIDERRAVVTTAALRSAVAWSRRADEPRAWREIARMTGVIMGAFGPGAGPATPSQLVAFLRRLWASCCRTRAGRRRSTA